MPPNRTRAGILLILAAVFSFASLDTLVKILSVRYSTPQLLWFRYTFHVLALLLVAWPFIGRRLFAAKNWHWQIGRGAILLLCSGLSFTGLHFMPLAEFTAIGFVAPLIVTVLAPKVLGEHISLARWCAVGAGFAGVMVIIRPGSGLFGWAALIPLAMAFAYASFQILTRKYAGEDDSLTTLFYSGLVGMLASALLLPWVWVMPPASDWPALISIGLIGAGGHYVLILAFRRADASVLAPITYVQLAFATLLGALLLDNVPDTWSFVGMGIVALAGLATAVLQAIERRRGMRAPVRRRPADEADVPLSD